MTYTVEIGSSTMIYIQSLVEIGSGIQSDLISLILFFSK
jgi:hypothetical protein